MRMEGTISSGTSYPMSVFREMNEAEAGTEQVQMEDTEEIIDNENDVNLIEQMPSQEIIKTEMDEEKIFEEAHTLHALRISENADSLLFQCACCARNYNEPYSSTELNPSTVLESLSTLLEFPTIVSNKSSLIFSKERVSSEQDWLFCLDCGQHISALYKMFQQFRTMLQKEGQIWRAIAGGRSLRRRNQREVHPVLNEPTTKVTLSKNNNLPRSTVKKRRRKKTGNNVAKNRGRRPRTKISYSEDKVEINTRSEEEINEDEFDLALMGDTSSEPEWQNISHSKTKTGRKQKPIRRSGKKDGEPPTFAEGSTEFNDSTTSSNSKRIRNWKKESWIEKAKTDPSRTCDLCGKSFIFPAVMKRHKKIVHQGLKPYECTSCGKRFTQKVILNKHTCDFSKEAGNRDVLQMNREDQLRKFICSVCGKRFKYPTHLNLHEMNHREERPYPCQQCDKTFRRPDHLKYHVRIVHVDEKKFICTKCGQTFKSISSLRAHEKKHTSDQGHLCNICGKSIKSMYQMSRHKKTHQDELPFECPVCGKRFKMKDYLGQHLRRGKTCSKKLPSFKDNNVSNNSSVAGLPQTIVVQTIPMISESDAIIRRDTIPSNSDCRNYGPVASEIVTLEFSSCFPVDERLLTEL